jgi:putative endonuclease
MPHFIYILQSLKDNSFYIGSSQDPEERLIKHNKANTGYTARKKPWKIVYVEKFESKTEALKREKFLKAQKNSLFYISLIEKAS